MLTDQEIVEAKRALKELADEAQGNGNSEGWIAAQERPILAIIAAHEAKAAPAVPQGEPVMWVMRAHETGQLEPARPHQKAKHPKIWSDAFPLYAAPSQEHAVNLSCRSTQARLAAQWGYVPAPSQEPDVPQGFKPVGYLRSDEFDGHVFEPIDGTWPFDELLFSLSTSPEPVQEVTLTDSTLVDIQDRLVSISGYVADQDDMAAQAILKETLKIISALREKEQAK